MASKKTLTWVVTFSLCCQVFSLGWITGTTEEKDLQTGIGDVTACVSTCISIVSASGSMWDEAGKQCWCTTESLETFQKVTAPTEVAFKVNGYLTKDQMVHGEIIEYSFVYGYGAMEIFASEELGSDEKSHRIIFDVDEEESFRDVQRDDNTMLIYSFTDNVTTITFKSTAFMIGDMGIVKSDMWMNRLTEYNDVMEIEIITMTVNPASLQATLKTYLAATIKSGKFVIITSFHPEANGTADVHDLNVYIQFMHGMKFVKLVEDKYKLLNNNSIQRDQYHIYQYERVFISSGVAFNLELESDETSFVGRKHVIGVYIETHTAFLDGVATDMIDCDVLQQDMDVYPTSVSYMYSPKMVLDQSNTTALQIDSLLYLCHSSPERMQKCCIEIDLVSNQIRHLPYKITLLIGYNDKFLFVTDNKFRPLIYNAHDGSLEYTSQKNFELERQKPDFVSSIELDGETQQADVTFEADTFSVLGGYGLKKGIKWMVRFMVDDVPTPEPGPTAAP